MDSLAYQWFLLKKLYEWIQIGHVNPRASFTRSKCRYIHSVHLSTFKADKLNGRGSTCSIFKIIDQVSYQVFNKG